MNCTKLLNKFLFFFFILIINQVEAQIQVINNLTPDQLVQLIVGQGVQYSNVTYKGNTFMNGSFNKGGDIKINEGLVLSSGNVNLIPTTNPAGNASGNYNLAGDVDLNQLSGFPTHDAAVLEFDFVPLGNTLSFKYIFASEEYPEFIGPSDYNDAFGFFLSGPGITGTYSSPPGFPDGSVDIALLPDLVTPVSIFNINCNINSALYISNSVSMGKCVPPFVPTINDTYFIYDGFTVVLTATHTVVPCSTYHIKLVVADAVDAAYDSGVFLEKNSFSTNPITVDPVYTIPTLDTTMVEGCNNIILTFAIDSIPKLPVTIPIIYGGTADYGIDYPALPTSLVIPAGSQTASIFIAPLADGIPESSETLTITYANTTCSGPQNETYTYYINDYPPLSGVALIDVTVNCIQPVTLSAVPTGGIVPYQYLWGNGETTPTITVSPTSTTTYNVQVYDGCGSSTTGNVTVTFLTPTVDAGPDINICKGNNSSIINSGAGNFQSLIWTTSGTGSFDDATLIHPVYFPSAADNASGSVILTLTITPLLPCLPIFDQVILYLKDPPTPSLSGLTSICINTQQTYTTDAGMSAGSYVWTVTGGTLDAGQGTNTVNVTWISDPGTITVNYIDLNGCTAAVASSRNITVNPDPIAVITGANLVCLSTTNTYTCTTPVATYLWSIPPGTGTILSPVNTNSIDVTWTTPGFHDIQLVTTSATCIARTTPYTVEVKPLPVPTITNGPSNQSACLNVPGSIYTTEAAMAGYTWTVTGGIIDAGLGTNSISVTWNTVGTGHVLVSYSENGCAAASPTDYPVTVHALPVPDLSGLSSICINTQQTYTTDVGMAAGSYTWTVTGGTIDAGQGTNTVDVTWTSDPGMITVNYIDLNGCTAAVASSRNITVNPDPIAVITGANLVCLSTTNTYTCTTPVATYLWSIPPGTGTILTPVNTNSIDVTWTTPGLHDIQLITTSVTCPARTTPYSVTVKPLPVPTITNGPANQSACLNVPGSIYTTEAAMAGYNWTVTGGVIDAGLGTNSISVTWNTAGTGHVLVSYSENGCAAASPTDYPVTVHALPVPDLSGPASICINSQQTYTTDAGMIAGSYLWTVTGGTINSGQGTSSLTVTWTSDPGTITVNYTDLNGCTAATASTRTITVNPDPVATVTGPPQACLNTTQTYVCPTTVATYAWSLPAGGGSIITPVNGNSIDVTWSSVGFHDIQLVTTSATCAPRTKTYTVEVKALPVPSITNGPANANACLNVAGSIYTTQALMSGYTWNVTGGTINSGSGTNSISVTWNTVGVQTVSIIYTDGNGCVASPATDYPVTVHDLPTPGVLTGPPAACLNSTGNIYTTQSGGGINGWNWNILPAGSGTITSGAGTSAATVTWNTVGTSTITINYTDGNGCTATTPGTTSVTVNPLPSPMVTGDAAPCLTTTKTYTADANGVSNFVWTYSAGGTLQGGGTLTDNYISIKWNTGGAQTVTLNYKDANGCMATLPTVYNVTVNSLPAPTIAGATSVCVNSTGFVYTTQPGNIPYTWVVNGGIPTAGGTPADNTCTVTWNTVGLQNISVNYTNAGGCSAGIPTQYDVLVHALPVITITPSVPSPCAGSTGNVYTTESTAGITGYNWNVSAGGTVTAGAGTSAITVTWTTAGAKTVSVNYTDAFGCTATAPKVLNVTVNPLPVPTIAGAAAACVGSTGNIYTTQSGGGISGWTWTITPPAAGTITAGAGTGSATVTWNTVGSQTISVNYVNSFGCTAAAATPKPVTINPLPVPTVATGPTFVCEKSVGNVYSTQAGKSAYSWTLSPGGSVTAGAGTASITVTWNTAGAKTVSVSYDDAVSGCRGTSVDYNVTVNPLPVPVISNATFTACESVPGNVYTTAAGMPNYLWNIPPAGLVTAGGGNLNNTVTITWTVPGTHTISLNYTDLNGCTAQAPVTKNIVVTNYPVSDAGPDDYMCSGDPPYQINLSNPSFFDPSKITWTITGSGFTPTGTFGPLNALHPTYTPSVFDLSVPRLIFFQLTVEGNGSCAGQTHSDVMEFRTDPIPVADAGPNKTTCGLTPVQIDGSADYQSTITWSSSTGRGTFLPSPSVENPTFTADPLDVGTTIQLTMDLVGCKNKPNNSTTSLTIYSEPTVNISAAASAICQGETTTVIFTLTGSPPWDITYSNPNGPGDITETVMSSPHIINITPTTTSNISMVLKAASDIHCAAPGANLTGSVNITVNPLPNIFNVTATNNGFYCDGDAGVRLGLDNSETGMTYELLYNNLSLPAPAGPLVLPGTGFPLDYGWFTTVGQYSVLATNPAASCNAMMNDTINVVMNPIPVVDFATNNACSGDTTVFTITSTGGFIDGISTWNWDFGDGTLLTFNAPVNPVKHIYANTTTYQAILSVTDTNGCHYRVTHPVVVLPHPTSYFSFTNPNCFGLTTQFTDLCQNPPGQGYLTQWIWNFGDGSPVQTINFPPMPVPYNPTHTYTSPGTYMVTLTVSNSKGCSDTYQAPVTIARLPVAGFSYQGNCQDLATAFFDNSNPNGGGQITGWHWDFGDAISGTPNTSLLQDPTHTYSVPGPYTVTLIITNLNGCKDTIAKGIMVKTSPLVDFTNDTACLGTATHFWADTLVSDPLAVATYLWDFGDNNTSLVRNASNTYVAPGTYTVSLTITDTAGCSNVKTHTITVHPSPVAHFTATNTTCQGQVVTFTDQSVANSAYMSRWVWDFGDGSPSQTFTFPALPPNPNTTYTYTNPGTFGVTLTVTNSDGCTHSETRVIEVLSAPVADFSSSGRCVSTAVSFTDKSAVVLPQALSSWRWNFGEPSSGTANTSTLQNPVHTYSTVNTFTVTLITFTANGCSDTITHDVTTQALPVVDFTFTSACMGNPVQFSPGAGMSPGAIGNWLWSFGDGGTAGTQAPVHTYTAPGTYNITLSVTDTAGCSNVKTGSITIKPSPDASFSISGPGCQGDTIRFINTTAVLPSGFIARYLWNFGDGNTQSVFFPSSPDVTHQYFNSGTFNVSLLVVSSDSCSDTYSGIVTIQPRPTAAFMHGSACQGGAVQFTDISNSNTTGSISGWAWDFGDAASGTANQSTLQNPAHTYNTSGTYTVLLSVTLSGGCSDDTTMQVVVAAPPTVDFTSVAGCNGDTTEFTSTVNPAGTQGWFWQFGDGGTSVIPDPIHIYANAGTYQVILTITDTAGCVNSKTKAVVVAPAPLAAFAVSSPGCSGLPVILTDLSSASGGSLGTWYWTFGDGNDTTYNSVLPTFTHTYTQPGTFTITLKVITATGCENTTTHTAIISASPIADFNYGGTCQGQSTQFTDITNLNGGGTLTQHTWNFGDPASGIQNTSTQTNPVHTYALAGTYTVVLTTVNASGCNDSVSRSVVISPKPGVDFYADSLVCMGSTTTFYTDTTATQVAAVTYYNWDFGDGGPHAFTRNASHSYTVAGTYTVRLTIQDTLGCGNTITHPVTIHPSPITQFVFSGVCENSPTHFTDLSIPPTGDTIVSWYWDFGVNGITTDTSTLQNPKFTYTLPATYSITLTTRTEHGCANTKVLPLQVWNTPTAWFKYTSSPCTNGLVQFQDSSWSYQGIINSWQWEFEPFQFGTGTNPSHLYFAVDSCYDVRLSVTDLRGCVDTTVLNVCVLPPFTVDFTNTNTCFGNAVAFTPQLITPAAPADTLITFHWDFGDPATGTQNISTLKKPAHTFSKAGFYTVNFTSTDKFGCTASQFHSIQVLALPVAGFGYTSGSCDSTITFANTSVDTSAALNMYVWMYGDGTPADTLYVPGSTHKYMRAGDYMASLTVVNANGCMDSFTDTVTRGSCLVAAYINVSDTLCQNLQIGFTDMSKCEGTISNWVWTFGDISPPTTYTVYQPQVFHTYDTAGVYTVKLRVSTVVGASTISDSTSRTILVKPSPLAGFSVAPSCLGSKTHFSNTTQANGATALSYRWDFGDAGTADTSLLKSPEYLYPIAGVYTTMMKAINQQGCWDTVSSLIRVNGLPEARFSNNPPCSQQIVQFVDSSLAYIAPVVSWHWRVSDSLGLLAILQGDTVSYVFDSTGRYNVQLLVADTNGCSDTLTQWITVNRSPVSAFSFTENVDDIQGHIQFTNGSIGSVQYNWDFGNGENSYAESPLMTYADDGDYPVILVSTSKEGCNDTALLIYKMLFKGLYVPNAFAPEGMASETRIWKPVGVNLESYQCEIFNSYGALVWSSIKLDSWGAPLEGWEGYYMDNNNTSHKCPQDVYVWKITAKFRDGTIWTNKDMGEHEGLSEPVWGTLTLIR